MPGMSNKTQVIAIRLPLDVVAIAARRVRQQDCLPMTISEYLRRILVYQLTRSHHKRRGAPPAAPGGKS